MKKAGGFFFSKWYYLEKIAKIISFRKKISSLFQYSERTIASPETNNTSKERSDTQLFGAGKFEGGALSGGLHAHLPQKDNDQKVNLTEESQEAIKKKINLANLILILWGKSGVKEFEFENKKISFCPT